MIGPWNPRRERLPILKHGELTPRTCPNFLGLYGYDRTNERLQAVGDLRLLHAREPRNYTLAFVRNSWNTLNHRWVQEIKEGTNLLRLHARVDRPTYDQLKSIGMTIGPSSNKTIFQRPEVFNVIDVSGYFQTEIVRKMNAEKELEDWPHYHNTPARPTNTGTGAVPVPTGIPGPPMTPAATNSPTNKHGVNICWNYNSNLGCGNHECTHSHELYKNPSQLSWAMQIVLAKRGCFKQHERIHDAKISDVIRDIRKQSTDGEI